MQEDDAVLRVEIKNSKPVDLIDLTTSLMALAQSFQDYANQKTADPLPDNMRLYVKELRSGSVIAELVSMTDQIQWIAEHIEVLAGFVGWSPVSTTTFRRSTFTSTPTMPHGWKITVAMRTG